jgi:hypothetical protein
MMHRGDAINLSLRSSGALVLSGLVVEALCLAWSRPVAFVVLILVGGLLIGTGVALFLYSLIGVSQKDATNSGIPPEQTL